MINVMLFNEKNPLLQMVTGYCICNFGCFNADLIIFCILAKK